jgi:ubiquinone/menaquinone biosynthesis C-methylase UbiE
MGHENFQLSIDAARKYESQKVTAIFRPLAEATIDTIEIGDDDEVIDVACGTGIVSRVFEGRFPGLRRIVGVDLSQGMIEQAQSLTASGTSGIEWYQSDVGELPFEDRSFTLAICQQGLQFFPARETALAEIRRVLKPGGRLVVTVWSRVSPLFLALAQALETHVSTEVAQRSLAPFTFNDEALIRSLIKGAGFGEVSVSNLTIMRKMAPAAQSIPAEIGGAPFAAEVDAKGEAVMQAIVESVDENLADFRSLDGFEIPQESYLFQGRSRNQE